MGNTNVLLITTDEQRYDTLGCNGNRHIKTPHLDRLAAGGINFTGHTTSHPVCSPARASILTGQYPRTHGVWGVGVKMPAETRGLSHWLADAGYRCGIFGKVHLEAELSGYVERLDKSKPYCGFQYYNITEDNQIGEYLDWIKTEHPEYWEAVRNNTHEGVRDTPLPDLGPGHLPEVYTSTAPEELHQTAWIADRTIDFLEDARGAGEPFFAWCSFVDPHHPWKPPEPFASMYDPAALPPPIPAPKRAKEEANPYSGGNILHEELLRMSAAYYAMISHIDCHVGRILERMGELSLLDNTLIIFTSDHGDYNGDRGQIRKGSQMYENILRIPLIVRVPGSGNGARECHGPTQLEDLAPTILEELGLEIPPSIQGVSFSKVLRDRGNSPREFSYFEHAWWRQGDRITGIRKGPWKLMYYPGEPGWVLNNLDEDPQERRNVMDEEGSREIVDELKAELLRWLLETSRYRIPNTIGW